MFSARHNHVDLAKECEDGGQDLKGQNSQGKRKRERMKMPRSREE